jgi:hypothetical protein
LFLTGSDLTDATRRVLGGTGLRCAVAFWGLGAAKFIGAAGGKVEEAKILCDISMGATNPEALVELNAPGNSNLRRHDGLHAKVYISVSGMVIGSPNATSNGLGFREAPVLLEAGTFHQARSKEWHAAVAWFDGLHRSAKPIDDAGLAEARRRWLPLSMPSRRPVRDGSLLDRVCQDPGAFDDSLGFVFVSRLSLPEHVEAAFQSAKEQSVNLEGVSKDSVFSGWPKEDVQRWRMLFIEFWINSKGRLRVFGRGVRGTDPENGFVIGVPCWPAVRKLLPPETPSVKSIELHDVELAKRLLDKGRGVMFQSARDLAEALGCAPE